MADPKPTLQPMNGCAACAHTAAGGPDGVQAAALGNSHWCRKHGKAVDARDGACPGRAYAR